MTKLASGMLGCEAEAWNRVAERMESGLAFSLYDSCDNELPDWLLKQMADRVHEHFSITNVLWLEEPGEARSIRTLAALFLSLEASDDEHTISASGSEP